MVISGPILLWGNILSGAIAGIGPTEIPMHGGTWHIWTNASLRQLSPRSYWRDRSNSLRDTDGWYLAFPDQCFSETILCMVLLARSVQQRYRWWYEAYLDQCFSWQLSARCYWQDGSSRDIDGGKRHLWTNVCVRQLSPRCYRRDRFNRDTVGNIYMVPLDRCFCETSFSMILLESSV